MYKVGVIGYSSQQFDKETARVLLERFLNIIEKFYTRDSIAIVSGLTNLGIPAVSYDIARERSWYTVGIACARASEFEVFPVNLSIIEGTEWGDESELFVSSIDCLIRIGGGQQSRKEVRMFFDAFPDKPIFEAELPTL